ncbi:MAG: SDR family mycofactocin-dependent oxidoreductase [Gordonia sp.]|nr:SDR family mycofactocin-dependent oxidoreductase [Gordonia sp. (in: high G+C Gram-positive bacteria)]
MARELDGRVAIVTGGARGQGRAHARALAAAGAHVVVADIADQIRTVPYEMPTEEDLDATVDLIRSEGGVATATVVDVRDSEAVDDLVQRTIVDLGGVEILIANAGICGFSTVAEISDEVWRDMIDTNLTGTFNCVRAVLPTMSSAGYGRIIAISSGAGRSGMANLGHYGASKWGIIGLIKTVAIENGPFGITANVVCPTTVNTPMVMNPNTFGVFCPDIDSPTIEDATPRFAALSPLGIPWLEPEDVTRAVMYLVNDPGYTSGTVLEVNLATSASRL